MSSTLAFPRTAVQLDGRALAEEDTGTLEAVRVQQWLSLPTQCELAFFNPEGPLADAAPTVVGSSLRVEVLGHADPLFVGEVTAVEYTHEPSAGLQVRIRGYDVLHRLRKRQPVRAHVQVTLEDLARELVSDLGLSVEAVEPGPVWHRLIQHRQSDLGLVREVAERCGLFLALRGNVLHVITLEGIGGPLPLKLGESLLEARIEVNGDSVCRSVLASGWDPWHIERHEGRASASRVGRAVKAEVLPSRVGGTGERILTNETAQDDPQADALAQAELDLRVAREVTLWGVAEGDPCLLPGARVDVEGLAGPLAGQYVLTSVVHTIDRRRGFVSEISSVPPKPGERSKALSAAPGIVTRVDDPDHRGRVRVSLPTLGNMETEWMGVLATAAGRKGLVALPDVGDHVLVLFNAEDPAQGLVVGGLYGANVPSDWGIEGGSVQRYTFLTPGGQKLGLDDSRKLLRLENSNGSYLELGPEKVMLHSQADLEIEAPGRSVVIRGTAVDFQKA
ncbi:MAG TPA: phage baseplate assembly protein V [Terriglobia bacterium]